MDEFGLLKGRILDVGSGWGEMICEISKNAREDINLVGIEPDQE